LERLPYPDGTVTVGRWRSDTWRASSLRHLQDNWRINHARPRLEPFSTETALELRSRVAVLQSGLLI